jgi:hypothetical protein
MNFWNVCCDSLEKRFVVATSVAVGGSNGSSRYYELMIYSSTTEFEKEANLPWFAFFFISDKGPGMAVFGRLLTVIGGLWVLYFRHMKGSVI